MKDLGPCSIDGCPNQADRDLSAHGLLCSAHRRRLQASRAGGKALHEPVAKQQPSGEYLRDMILRYADLDSEDDDAFDRAEEELDNVSKLAGTKKVAFERVKRAMERYGSELAQKEHGNAVRLGQAEAKAKGVRIGRPPKLDRLGAEHAVKTHGGVVAAAAALGVSRVTIWKALLEVKKVRVVSEHGDLHSWSPPEEGD